MTPILDPLDPELNEILKRLTDLVEPAPGCTIEFQWERADQPRRQVHVKVIDDRVGVVLDGNYTGEIRSSLVDEEPDA